MLRCLRFSPQMADLAASLEDQSWSMTPSILLRVRLTLAAERVNLKLDLDSPPYEGHPGLETLRLKRSAL